MPIALSILKDPTLNANLILASTIQNYKSRNKSLNDQKVSVSIAQIDKFKGLNIHPFQEPQQYSHLAGINYYLTEEHLNYFLLDDKKLKSWDFISSSTRLIWTDELINKHKKLINWRNLSHNKSISWDDHLINKYKDYLHFDILSYNINLNITKSCLQKYGDKWDWAGLSGNPTIFKIFKYDLLRHKKAVWYQFPKYKEYGTFQIPYPNLNSTYVSRYDSAMSEFVSLSTNPAIFWDKDLYREFGQKVDLWQAAFFSQFDNELLVTLDKELRKNRFLTTNLTSYSDWTDQHDVIVTGWENILTNNQINYNYDLLRFLYNNRIEIVRWDGNASFGHEKKIEYKSLMNILADNDLYYSRSNSFGKQVNLKFEELIKIALPDFLLSEYYIDWNLYNATVSPFLRDNEYVVKRIFNYLLSKK